MNYRYLFYCMLALALPLLITCKKKEKDPEKPEIKVSPASQAVFSSGLLFDSGEAGKSQSKTVSFSTTAPWKASVQETVKSSSWLSLQPSSGEAGDVTMTVSAEPNLSEAERNATVTISCGSVSQSFTVRQAGITVTTIPVESVSLSQSSLTLKTGDSATLTAIVKPDNATDKTVSWSSSNSDVASVDQNGKVTAVAEGTATIIATAGDMQATCAVTVQSNAVAVESVTLNKSSLTLSIGNSETLVATVSPDNATDKSVSWASSNSDVASVDQNGKVTAVAEGTATITATAGDKQATCAVTVQSNAVAVESVTLNKSSLTLSIGDSESLVATVSPDNATDKSVSWTSSNSDVASVDQNGKVTAVAEGTATITATAGDKQATCAVTVQPNVVAVESVTLNKSSLTLSIGDSESLVATVSPDNATDKSVSWTSSDSDVASVDQNGKVTAVAEGTATITATAGDKQATCAVSVQPDVVAVESVTLNKSSLALDAGESETLVATVLPDNATDKTVTWNSSAPQVAAVDQTGKVIGVSEGTATITATAGNKQAACTVTVTIPVESVTLNEASLSLEEGTSAQLIATVHPDNATNKTVSWSSSDTQIANVNQEGEVTALEKGTATITASAGGKSATCTVTVFYKFEISPTEVSVSGEGGTFTITVTCSGNYELRSKPSWITEQSVENKVHTFKAAQNPDETERSGAIVFVNVYGTNLSCQVKQEGHSDQADGGNEGIGYDDWE